MAIVSNDAQNVKHKIQVIDSKDAPYATKELLDKIVANPAAGTGIKRDYYYIIDTRVEFRGYPEHRKEFAVFEKLVAQCRRRGTSLIMIKFPKDAAI